MSENGKTHKSVTGEVIGLLEDQMDLASLEWDFEKKQGARRIGAIVAASILGFAAFALLQVAIVIGIVEMGMRVVNVCLLLAGVDVGLAVLFIRLYARRPAQLGAPFQGTREELKKNLKWIQQILS